MLTDIEIAKQCKMNTIENLAASLGIDSDEIEPYGHYKAKLTQKLIDRMADKKDGKLILVTAINPTPAGEGKTTVSVGLGQGLKKIGKSPVIALREPSLGPVFGVKGGAAGGGYSQVVPMEDINLHFTGDMHAITAANNLLCAIIDNHLQQGNVLGIDPRTITFKRVMDMNDRALRNIVVGMGGRLNGVVREDGFMITVASEIMAILCLSSNLADLKIRLEKILIGYDYSRKPIYAGQLGVSGAMAALLKDAINPNLVQTLEGVPTIMHGGPFANIAHGCNSIRATKLALKLGDYCVTEAGFGSDLGAEKFLDIKCRMANLMPNAIVIVATVRALKYNGGVPKSDLNTENTDALKKGLVNLQVHIENMKKFGTPVIVTLNHFYTDTDSEVGIVSDFCKSYDVPFAVSKVFADGGDGGIDLANLVVTECEKESNYKPLYKTHLSVEEKIKIIAKEIYRADGVDFSPAASRTIKLLDDMGYSDLPICIAKTQYSLSDNSSLLGHPTGFRISVKEIRPSLGAGFIVALTGDIMTMPGLPKIPAAENIDIDKNGEIDGLF